MRGKLLIEPRALTSSGDEQELTWHQRDRHHLLIVVLKCLPEDVQAGALGDTLRTADVGVFDLDAVTAAKRRHFQPPPQSEQARLDSQRQFEIGAGVSVQDFGNGAVFAVLRIATAAIRDCL